MSLEAAIAENTAAINNLIATITASDKARAEGVTALNALKDGAAAGEPAKRGRPAGSKKDEPAAAAPEKSKLTLDEVRKEFAEYMNVDDATEKEARVTIIKGIYAKLGVAKALEIKPEQFRVALDYLNEAKNSDPAPDTAGDDDDLV